MEFFGGRPITDALAWHQIVDKFSLYEMSLLDQKISQVVVKGRRFELNFERQLVSYLGRFWIINQAV